MKVSASVDNARTALAAERDDLARLKSEVATSSPEPKLIEDKTKA